MGFDIYRKFPYICEECGLPGSSDFTPKETTHPGKCRMEHKKKVNRKSYEALKLRRNQNHSRIVSSNNKETNGIDGDIVQLKLYIWDASDVPAQYRPVVAYAVNAHQARLGVARKIWGDDWKSQWSQQIAQAKEAGQINITTEFDWVLKEPSEVRQPWFGGPGSNNGSKAPSG